MYKIEFSSKKSLKDNNVNKTCVSAWGKIILNVIKVRKVTLHAHGNAALGNQLRSSHHARKEQVLAA